MSPRGGGWKHVAAPSLPAQPPREEARPATDSRVGEASCPLRGASDGAPSLPCPALRPSGQPEALLAAPADNGRERKRKLSAEAAAGADEAQTLPRLRSPAPPPLFTSPRPSRPSAAAPSAARQASASASPAGKHVGSPAKFASCWSCSCDARARALGTGWSPARACGAPTPPAGRLLASPTSPSPRAPRSLPATSLIRAAQGYRQTPRKGRRGERQAAAVSRWRCPPPHLRARRLIAARRRAPGTGQVGGGRPRAP